MILADRRGRRKNFTDRIHEPNMKKICSLFLPFLSLLLLVHCGCAGEHTVKIGGAAQGTTYHITYIARQGADYKKNIDSILLAVDNSLSTYVPHSIISQINRNDSNVVTDDLFVTVFQKGQEIAEKTGGLFDITVAPVINAWGFGATKKAQVDSAKIDSLLQRVGYGMVRLEGRKLLKANPQIQLDFNALAQGYTVDLLAAFLESKGIDRYLVELGGEVKAKGQKINGAYWEVGIDQPNETYTDGRPLKAVVRLQNKALATSGNYRRFYVENGRKYAHIIDPRTGYPAKHNLLSATVIAGDCMTADAYATAFMVMGLEKTKEFLAQHKDLGLEVFLIYDAGGKWGTYTSETLKEWIKELP